MTSRSFSEFKQHWRALLACCLGMGSALSVNSFILATFAPYMLKEFGWTQGQWSRVGLTVSLAIFAIPISGRLADRFGVRRVVSVGVIAFPLCCVAISQIAGDIRIYVGIYIFQTLLCCSTTAAIYTRVIAERFQNRLGLALAMCVSTPALFGGVGSPLISNFVQTHDWRNGYLLVAAFSALCGAMALWLLPADPPRAAKPANSGYLTIFSKPVFWAMLVATFLVSQPIAVVGGQMKLILLSEGATSDTMAAYLISAFAIGTISGRLIAGSALDYFPPHSVAALFLGLPFAGLLLLASGMDSTPALVVAMLLIGMAVGGEGDVIGYLVVRYFGVSVYSTVLGLMTSAIAMAAALGHLLMARTYDQSHNYAAFLAGAAVAVLAGSVLFQLLGRFPVAEKA